MGSSSTSVLSAALCSLFACAPAAAGGAAISGSYEISFKLELPHIESNDETTRTVCLANAGVEGGTAIPVLSDNNPLAHCPVSNLHRSGDEFSFDIVCPGGNSAKGWAIYTVGEDRFQGSIAMNMGGKNMTMTEVQHGRRIGDCSASKAAAPARP